MIAPFPMSPLQCLLQFSSKAIEVLLHNKAFVVKRSTNETGRMGQVTWSKFESILAAWQTAKERAGFN